MQEMTQPLLSICVPTYNRADRLRVMLQAVLPQVAEHSDRVELWISDNASTDETSRVIEDARRLGPLNYSRNDTNLEIVGNVIKCAAELARGEFVWLLGDDDLLLPGAVSLVLGHLETRRELPAIYFNFRYSSYLKHWPEEAVGGYRGPFEGLANPETTSRPVRRWYELIRPETCLCTQVYAHVIRRDVWVNYWRGRALGSPYSNVRMTFPHTCMLAETMMHGPTFYVGEPVLNIFNGAQSWNHLMSLIMLLRLPELLRLYQRLGLPEDQARACERVVLADGEPFLANILRGEAEPGGPGIGAYLRSGWRYPNAWRTLVRVCRATGRPRALNLLLGAATRMKGALQGRL